MDHYCSASTSLRLRWEKTSKSVVLRVKHIKDYSGSFYDTPDEEVRINKRQRRAEVLSWLLAVPIGLLIVAMIVVYKLTVGDGKLFVGEVICPIVFVAVALSSFFVGRVYRKHMEQKLGRRLRNEYELTSLNSWMEASKKDEPQQK